MLRKNQQCPKHVGEQPEQTVFFIRSLHYENTPIQMYRNFHTLKNENFQIQTDIFSYFCPKHKLWILVRTALARQFERVPTNYGVNFCDFLFTLLQPPEKKMPFGSKFFPFIIDPSSEGDKTIMTGLPPMNI